MSNYVLSFSPAQQHGAAPVDESMTPASPFMGVATQLQRRLGSEEGYTPSIRTLEKALQKRQIMLRRSVTVTVRNLSNPSASGAVWTLSLAAYPDLLTLRLRWPGAEYVVDEVRLEELLRSGRIAGMQAHVPVLVTQIVKEGKKIQRAADTPVATGGFAYDIPQLTESLVRAFDRGQTAVELEALYADADVLLNMSGSITRLSLLSSGLSNFTGSTDNRIWNVKKAVNERLHNIYLPQNAEFSFVDILGIPVTTDKGWKMEMGLFGGGAALTPGAGICQAATTMYRAVLLAGLPLTSARHHSMWVDHYEPYGAGLDATVFPGTQDLRFRNDTAGPLLIQAFIEGEDVRVNIYGMDDKRTVQLEGPYFYSTTPASKDLRKLERNQIGWINTVTRADGTVLRKPIVSTYVKGMPRAVHTKYAGLPGMRIMHELLP